MMLRLWAAAAALALGLAMPALAEQGKPVKVALIEDRTGPLEAYARQLITGFRMGIEYATRGTGTVAGRKIEIMEKDSQTKPDLGRTLLEQAYSDDDVDLAIGGTSSAVALAMLPVAQDYKKLLIVDGAVADSITGESGTATSSASTATRRRTRSPTRCRSASPGVVIATLAQDYAFGRDGVAAFKAALKPTGASWCTRNTRPPPPPTSPRRCSASSMRWRKRAGRQDAVRACGPAPTR